MTPEDGGDLPPDSGRSTTLPAAHPAGASQRRWVGQHCWWGRGSSSPGCSASSATPCCSACSVCSGEADLYNAAFVIPDYLFFLMAGGYLTITFLPILSRHIAAGDDEGEWRSFVAVFRPVALVMIGLTVLAMIWARPLVEFLYRSFRSIRPRSPDRPGAGWCCRRRCSSCLARCSWRCNTPVSDSSSPRWRRSSTTWRSSPAVR